MDNYSFLNAAHTAYLQNLYDQYLQQPDSVEPSWRAFFQGFDFGMENTLFSRPYIEVPEKFKKNLGRKADRWIPNSEDICLQNKSGSRPKKIQPYLDIENLDCLKEICQRV